MAIEHFYNAMVLYGPYDISADLNEVKLGRKQDIKDVTHFGDTDRRFITALADMEIEAKGWVQFDDSSTPKAIDGNLFAEIAGSARPFTICPSTADGSISYVGQTVAEDYSLTLNVQEPGAFDFKARPAGQFGRGKLILPLAARASGSGNGTVTQVGALTSTQKMIVTLHVTAFNGTTITYTVNSNDTADTVSPTVRGTFSAVTGVGTQVLTINGPITDTYWYISWSGTITSVTAAVGTGIR